MTCSDLIPYVDGELPRDRADAFREHLRTCARCPHDLLLHVEIGARLSTMRPEMQDAETRDRVRRAGQAVRDPNVCDPYVLTVATLANLIRSWINARDAMDDSAFSGIECGVAVRSLQIIDSRIRHIVDAGTVRQWNGVALQPQWSVEDGLRNLGSGIEPPPGWERRVLEKLPHESWWIRAWRWLWQ